MIKLVLSKPENSFKDFTNAVKGVKSNALIILASKPYSFVKNNAKTICSSKKCLFLDAVAQSSQENVVSISAENLTALSIAINQAQQSFDGKVTIVFDSVTNLSIKNDEGTLIKFFSFILSRSRDWNTDLVFVLPREGVDERLMSIIKQSSDRIEKK